MIFKTVDLCAGIGGIRRGFEMTGHFKNVLSAEIDRFACETYEHLYGENPQNDISTEAFKQKINSIEYDILLAGFPCQAFSRAGLEQGFQDKTKGTIFYDISKIIELTRPKAVFLENVDNFVRHDGGNTIEIVLETLENELNYKVLGVSNTQGELDYDVNDFIRNSRFFGVPQNRPRTYIVAFDRSFFGEKINNLNATLPQKNNLNLYDDLNDVLEMGAAPKYYLSEGYLNTLIRHRKEQQAKGNGFGFQIVNKKEIENPVAYTLMATGGSGKERNLVYDPQPDLIGQKVKYKQTPLNAHNIRMMTPREWGKLQGFIGYAFMDEGVDKFSFPKSISNFQKYKQFGNSVTIPAIETFAEFIFNVLLSLPNIPD